MEPEDLEAFKRRLVAMRDELRSEGDLSLDNTARAGGSGKIDDDAAPLSEMNQVIQSSRNQERTLRLRQIQGALNRLAEDPDLFGLCEVCEEEIPERRLELMPWATHCIACQSKSEDGMRGGTRKSLTDYKK